MAPEEISRQEGDDDPGEGYHGGPQQPHQQRVPALVALLPHVWHPISLTVVLQIQPSKGFDSETVVFL